MEEKMIGKIKWYKKEKKYGYIIGYDDESYYFELINCMETYDDFKKDEEVKFVPNWGKIDYATKVEKIIEHEEK